VLFKLAPPPTAQGRWGFTTLHPFLDGKSGAGGGADRVPDHGGVIFGADGRLYGATCCGGKSYLGGRAYLGSLFQY
jgi:hypothetical protein